jgi:hypothetical protein
MPAGATNLRGVLVVAPVALLVVGAFVYGVRFPAAIPGGPLGEDRGGGGVGFSADVGEPVSTGLLQLRNRSDVTAEIRRVELVGKDPGLTLVGAVVFPGHSHIGTANGFPPPMQPNRRARLFDAVGARIRPGQAVDVIIGFAASAPGKHGFERVAVRYRARGLPYRALHSLAGVVCAPESRVRSCLEDDF